MEIKDLCILGGGTSGLVAGLIIKKWNPLINITVIESKNIGIVGVGEGSTEHWRYFMEIANINMSELIRRTKATFKTGIKFTNWNGDNTFYMHTLHDTYTHAMPNGVPGVMLKSLAEQLPTYPQHLVDSLVYPPLDTAVNQFHFDTFLLNEFLHEKCVDANINFVIDDIDDVLVDHQGFASTLISKNKTYNFDFFIDCSGFKRVIASKLGAKWISCESNLPMNSAFNFATDLDDNFPSHTTSHALANGWMWKIPTQERYGNGYVFSNNFTSLDNAVEEVEAVLGHNISVNKTFNFNAGYVDQFWIKNVVSIGLSGSFVEPLEASSIGTSIQQSLALSKVIHQWRRGNDVVASRYNKQMEKVAQNIIDFVQLHYLTQRNDTEFWKSTSEIVLTDFNRETLKYFKHNLPLDIDFMEPYILFRSDNWIQILNGINYFNLNSIKDIWHNQDKTYKDIASIKLLNDREFFSKVPPIGHKDALTMLMDSKIYE